MEVVSMSNLQPKLYAPVTCTLLEVGPHLQQLEGKVSANNQHSILSMCHTGSILLGLDSMKEGGNGFTTACRTPAII